MKRRALGVSLVTLPDAPPYLAIDIAADGARPAERINIAVSDRQLADLLPDIVRRLRERLKGL